MGRILAPRPREESPEPRVPSPHRRRAPAVFAVLAVAAAACAGTKPAGLGVTGEGLAACPSSPNCVSSRAADAEHAVDALATGGDAAAAWQAAREAVASMPRTTIVTERANYLHAECRSALFRFVDDLELHLPEGSASIEVRSASRVGYSDMGVNRQRVENLRRRVDARIGERTGSGFPLPRGPR